jgi:hypothetical protein
MASLTYMAGVPATCQSADEIPAIGQINYFGYGGIDLQPIEAALPIKVGGVLSMDGLKSTQDLIEQGIKGVTGQCSHKHRFCLLR